MCAMFGWFRGQNFGFALKSCQSLGVASDRRGEHLDGDLTLQVSVGCPIHLAHAANADLGDDLVRSKAFAWL